MAGRGGAGAIGPVVEIDPVGEIHYNVPPYEALKETGTMQKKQMDDFRKKLEKKRKEILATITSARSSGDDTLADEVKDVADKALSSYSRELLYGLSDAERRTLQLVDEAIHRLSEKTFGQCTHCGEKIQPRRLEAVPWARHCINCQELQEKGYIK